MPGASSSRSRKVQVRCGAIGCPDQPSSAPPSSSARDCCDFKPSVALFSSSDVIFVNIPDMATHFLAKARSKFGFRWRRHRQAPPLVALSRAPNPARAPSARERWETYVDTTAQAGQSLIECGAAPRPTPDTSLRVAGLIVPAKARRKDGSMALIVNPSARFNNQAAT